MRDIARSLLDAPVVLDPSGRVGHAAGTADRPADAGRRVQGHTGDAEHAGLAGGGGGTGQVRRSLGDADGALIPMSASKITAALSCPLRAQRKYLQRLPETPSLAGHRGSMLHAALEASGGTSRDLPQHLRTAWLDPKRAPRDPTQDGNPRWRAWRELFAAWLELRDEMAPALSELDTYAEQIRTAALAGRRKGGAKAPRMTRDYLSREERLLAPWHDTLASLRAAERALLDDPQQSPWSPTPRSGFDEYTASVDVVRAYARWWDTLGEDRQPEVLHVEHGFGIPYEEFLLNGVIDRIDRDPVTGDVVVIDYKSGRIEGKTERFIQACLYVKGAEWIVGVRPAYVRFVNLDADPAGDDWTHTYPVQPGWDLTALRLCRWAHAALQGAPVPSFNGCRFCSYAELCFGADAPMGFVALEHAETTEEATTS